MAGGAFHSLALRRDGTVVAWGSDTDHQTEVPEGLSGVTALAAGEEHSLALKSDGTVVGWGRNDYGQVDVPAWLSGVTAIAASGVYSMALKSDGTVVAWGGDTDHQTEVPDGLSGVTAIAAGGHHSLALKSDGTVVGWGNNDSGQASVPVAYSGTRFTAISAGDWHSLALTSDGTVVAWGMNQVQQASVPAALTGVYVTAISAGLYHNLALTSDRTVVAWGYDYFQQSEVPAGLTDVTAIVGGGYHSMVLVPAPPPTITSADTATLTTGTAGSFTVTTTGLPTAAVTESGVLPVGVTFTDNGNGTATIAGTPTGSGGTYPLTLTATNGASPDATQNFTLQVHQAPTVATGPTDQAVPAGDSATFSVSGVGVPTPSVQWQRSTGPGDGFSDVPGATSTDYTFTAAAGDDGSQYRAVFTSAAGSVTSTAATLNVWTEPSITSTDHATFIAGEAGSFDVTTTPGRPSATTLHRSASGFPSWLTLTDRGDGTGALTGTPAADSAGVYSFTLTASNGTAPDASQPFTLTVAPPPVVAPPAPAIASATGGNGTATVTFTPPSSDGGAPITSYTVTASPGGKTVTGPASPLTVTGLTNDTAYTFTVTATNSAGTSQASAPSNPATPADPASIAAKYRQLGGPGSLLGNPTGPEYPVVGGTARNFEHGRIYSSPATGAHEVHGAILGRYLALGGPAGLLGFPTADETVTLRRDGRFNHFAGADGASIFWSQATGAWSIHGAIRAKWFAMGAEHGLLGYPVSDETVTLRRDGRFNHFAGADGASIFWSQATGAWSIHGAIRAKWFAMGAEHGLLGYPVSDETVTLRRDGRFNHFAGADGASIFWSPATGAWSIHGAIRAKWFAMGAEHGLLGYPVSDETVTLRRDGRFNHFAGADGASIFWSPATGAWSIHGAIRLAWFAAGAEHGRLGYPTSDEYPIPGGRQSTLARGSITWRPDHPTAVNYR